MKIGQIEHESSATHSATFPKMLFVALDSAVYVLMPSLRLKETQRVQPLTLTLSHNVTGLASVS